MIEPSLILAIHHVMVSCPGRMHVSCSSHIIILMLLNLTLDTITLVLSSSGRAIHTKWIGSSIRIGMIIVHARMLLLCTRIASIRWLEWRGWIQRELHMLRCKWMRGLTCCKIGIHECIWIARILRNQKSQSTMALYEVHEMRRKPVHIGLTCLLICLLCFILRLFLA